MHKNNKVECGSQILIQCLSYRQCDAFHSYLAFYKITMNDWDENKTYGNKRQSKSMKVETATKDLNIVFWQFN